MCKLVLCDEGVKCPWCGHIQRDSWEMNHESEDEIECGNCEPPITYIADVIVIWNSFKGDTSKIPKDELEKILNEIQAAPEQPYESVVLRDIHVPDLEDDDA